LKNSPLGDAFKDENTARKKLEMVSGHRNAAVSTVSCSSSGRRRENTENGARIARGVPNIMLERDIDVDMKLTHTDNSAWDGRDVSTGLVADVQQVTHAAETRHISRIYAVKV
jgi:hypothetical protein